MTELMARLRQIDKNLPSLTARFGKPKPKSMKEEEPGKDQDPTESASKISAAENESNKGIQAVDDAEKGIHSSDNEKSKSETNTTAFHKRFAAVREELQNMSEKRAAEGDHEDDSENHPRKKHAVSHQSGTQASGSDETGESEVRKNPKSAPARVRFQDPAPTPEVEPLELKCEYSEITLKVRPEIAKWLRPYQNDGVQFLYRQYCQGIGGVLADDMGLGKTAQTIAFISALLGTNEIRTYMPARGRIVQGERRNPILIITPPTLTANWIKEFSSWGGIGIKVAVYAGNADQKEYAYNLIEAGSYEVMLVGMELYRMNHQLLHQLPWHAVFVDEAHKLKNASSQVYQAVQKIPTDLRYFLTGTVMQNNYEELWNVLDLCVPGKVGERKAFMKFYAEPLKKARAKSASEQIVQLGDERQKRLHRLLNRYVLRRRKESTLPDQLPKKVDQIVFCRMSRLQTRAYRRLLSSPELQELQASFDLCSCGSGLSGAECCFSGHQSFRGPLWEQYHNCKCKNKYDSMSNPDGCKFHRPEGCEGRIRCPLCLILPALTLLKKISNHLDLVKADWYECGKDQNKMMRQEAVAQMILGEDAEEVGGHILTNDIFAMKKIAACGKLQALVTLLKYWDGGTSERNKILIFSSSVKMLDRIEAAVEIRHEYLRLDGNTSTKERQRLVDQFNTSPCSFLFLISTGAGGTGLNLATANKVIIMDPSWNPAQDLQAIDRAYRLGTKKDVHVFRFISAGSVEEVMYSRQVYKQQQANVALENMKEPRYFDAVQKEKGLSFKNINNGELFGLQNLFKLTAQKVEIAEIMANKPGKRPLPFEVKGVKEVDFAAIDEDIGVKNLENGREKDFDNLASHLANLAAQTGKKKVWRPPKDKIDHAEQILNDELQIIKRSGALTTMKHDDMLGARGIARQNGDYEEDSDEEGSPTRTQPSFVDREKASVTKPPKRNKSHLTALESLAEWQGEDIPKMAKRLLNMTEEERLSFRTEYGMECVA